MSLRFLLGPAGSGKTYQCLDEIVAALRENPRSDEPLYFLVPEQATFQTERALLEHDERVGAVSRARVVSFKRLAYFALEREGPFSRPFVGELGRLLALQVAVRRERDNLSVYRRSAETDGFVERVAMTLKEFKAYRHDVGSLRSVQARLSEVEGDAPVHLKKKLADLERIYAQYEELISGRFHDGDDALTLAAQAIEDTGFAANARVWIDGFAGFTPQEYALLEVLLKKAKQVTIALCLDPAELPSSVSAWDEGSQGGLFHPTRETLVALRDLADEAGVAIEPPVRIGKDGQVEPRFAPAPLLGRIERALRGSEGGLYPVGDADAGADEGRDGSKEGESLACSVLEAPDRVGEVEAAARRIVRLVRDHGYRYSDIALVVRTLDAYQSFVENVFQAWGIPYFIDQKGSAVHHPLVMFVEAALDMLAHGIETPSIIRWLKTDLSPLSRDEADRIENRAIELGATEKEWFDAGLWGDLDGVRKAAVDPLQRFLNAVRAACEATKTENHQPVEVDQAPETAPADLLARALYDLLTDVGVPEKLEEWADKAEQEGRRTEAGDHRQVWEGLCGLIDEIVAVMGDTRISTPEFVAACEVGLKRLRLGRVPAHVDEVLVGAIDRSRQPELKCVILLGWNEGVFPLEPAEDPILSDADRERLRLIGMPLGPESKERLFHERYLIYIALTRASERLVLIYSRSDETGRPLRPSPVISWLLSAFSCLRPEALPARHSPWELPERPGALWGWLARGFRAGLDGDPIYKGAERRLEAALRFARERLEGADQDVQGVLSPGSIDPLAGLTYQNRSERISPDLVASIYNFDSEGRLVLSPSGLEDAASCPFKFFAGYGLVLRERNAPKLDAALLGTLSHAVLREVVARIIEGGKDWADWTYDESDALVRASFESVRSLGEYAVIRRSAAADYASKRLLRALEAVVRTFVDGARVGAFRPVALEVSFGPGAALPPLIVGEGRYVGVVRGRIDRIDEARGETGTYVRVVDYKSSANPMRLSEVYYGLDLQLCIYLAVVVSGGRGWKAGGCLYVPVVDPVASVDRPEDGSDDWRKLLKPHGLIVDDGEAPRLMDAVSTGSSPFLPIFFKRDGTLGATSKAAPPDAFHRLLDYVASKAGSLVETVASGDTSIAPIEHGNERACTFCAYKAVCQIDGSAPSLRRLRPLRDEEVWERIEHEGGDARVG